jgi:TRAP-type C4-dicarboxylate transport system permease small subunit
MRVWLKRLADAVGAGLFAVLFGVFIVQIVARFGFGRPLPWTDELAVILYIWSILWAAAFMVPAREHVVFDLVYNLCGPRTRRGMLLLGSTMIGALAASGLPGAWDYVRFMGREGTPVLGWSFTTVFMPFVLLLAALVVRNAWQAWRLLRGDPPDAPGLPS